MKKIILTSMSALLLATGAANAASTPYAALRLGYNWLETDTDPDGGKKDTHKGISGFIGGVAGGMSFGVSENMAARVELGYEYGYAKGRLESGQEKSTIKDNRVLASGYLDFGDGKGLTPYVGASLGYAFGTLDSGAADVDVGGIGAGLSAGVSYAVSEKFAADFGVRYFSTSRTYDEKSGEGDFDICEWSFLFGARYAF